MSLYSGAAEVVIDGAVVTPVQVVIDGDPEGEWEGEVYGPPGQSDPPAEIEATDWLVRLADGREIEVTTASHALISNPLDPWHTGFYGIGVFPA